MTELQGWLVDWVDQGLAETGRSQAELASELAISQKHLSQVLTGRAQGSLQLWDGLLRAVGVHERALAAG